MRIIGMVPDSKNSTYYRTSPCRNDQHDWCGATKGSARTKDKCECWCHKDPKRYKKWVGHWKSKGVSIRNREF